MKAQGDKTVIHSITDVESEEADSFVWRLVRVGVVLGAVVLFVLWAVW
ncbi:MAG: hypothetical protein AAF591_08725 [Verrucomicrobiota bacterium]